MEHVHGVDIFDIYGISYEPWWVQTWFIGLCITAIIILVVGIIYYVYLRKKNVPLSYVQKTLHDVDTLSALADDIEKAHEFYCSLTNILKEYLFHTYEISTSYTDEELLEVFKVRSDIPHFVVHAATEILQGIDIIKFGQGIAVAETMHKALSAMRKIIQGTMHLFPS